MNKLICPLSEEFLYCSPELPEKGCYRVLMKTGQSKQPSQKNRIVSSNGHVQKKGGVYKKLGIKLW